MSPRVVSKSVALRGVLLVLASCSSSSGVVVDPAPGSSVEGADGKAEVDAGQAQPLYCAPGSYLSSQDGAPTCAACPAGRFSAEPNLAACTAWSTCAPGQRVETEGSSTRDRTCVGCEPGTSTALPNQAECVAVTSCPAGKAPLSTSSSPEGEPCAACEPGTYCAGGSSPTFADLGELTRPSGHHSS